MSESLENAAVMMLGFRLDALDGCGPKRFCPDYRFSGGWPAMSASSLLGSIVLVAAKKVSTY